MSELKNTAIFSAAYERVTGQEVWINTELYDKFCLSNPITGYAQER